MKKLIVLMVVILIIGLFAGCWTTPEPIIEENEVVDTEVSRVYDLTGYNSNALNSAMASYNTPEKIVKYMADHFTWHAHSTDYTPYEQWLYEDGDCNDFATFAIYCAYKCAGMPRDSLYQVRVKYTNGNTHILAIYALYPWSSEFNCGYSSNGHYYHDRSFKNWYECVKHHDTKTTKTVLWAKLYNYDYRWYQTVYF